MRAFRIALLVFVSICAVLRYSRTQAENLEAGKSVRKLFSSNCEHYTASQTAAYELAAFSLEPATL
jgi:hypothetical protein